jgi:hypothetical protein
MGVSLRSNTLGSWCYLLPYAVGDSLADFLCLLDFRGFGGSCEDSFWITVLSFYMPPAFGSEDSQAPNAYCESSTLLINGSKTSESSFFNTRLTLETAV